MKKIGFLHTSPVHIPTFETLLQDQAESIDLVHTVDEAVLAHAVANGVDGHVEDVVARHLAQLQAAGCDEIVCTCSTIGAIAENWGDRVMRIDRPMAASAVAQGHVILMVAAIKSTLIPTRTLLLDESERQNRPIRLVELVVEAAWAHFLSGDLEAYYQTVATEIESFFIETGTGRCKVPMVPEVVVLAQGSMAPAADLLSELGVPVLTSPKLCADHLKHAITQ